MKTFPLLPSLTLLAIGSVPLAIAEPEPPEGFTAIFNGKDLKGWHGNNPHTTNKAAPEERDAKLEAQQEEFLAHWSIENGELVNDGKGPYATTNQDHGDIELHVDYRTVAKADSGIYLRGTPQVQIWDFTEEGGKWKHGADKGSGGLWNNSKDAPGKDPMVLADRPFGQWNSFRIKQVGARTWITLNDKLVVEGAIMENFWDRKSPLPATGPIHLQTHGGEIRWRDIFLREIPGEEATAMLRGDDQKQGFTSLFDGETLKGWTGATENYEVVDGAIRCKKGKGGVLHTKKKYGDFVVRFEFKVPEGGNNGLAIRYPGKGDTAYVGMCELQVLDNSSPKFAKLDERQYHGSAYGMAAAHRGFQRPVGEWNYQEVTVKGSTIRVELNGTVILDTDLSKVTEYMGKKPHPGKDNTEGFFGFAGHSSPVSFRNIAIKKL